MAGRLDTSGQPLKALHIEDLLKLAIERGASDLHLTDGTPPIFRVDGKLQPADLPTLGRAELKQIIYSILTDRQKARFERDLELDFSVEAPHLNRVRVNVHLQRGSVEAAFRIVPVRIRSLEELGLPPVTRGLAALPSGLVLVTGPTGMGKTTTLAAIVDLINREQPYHIMIIEDPIEYVHTNKRSIIKQREVYADTPSFGSALKHALRQDPNVIVIGEMRDLETISTALTAAETGHLVLGTLHTPDASQTIDRIIDVFPPYQQQQVRVQLAGCLQGIVTQQLLPRADGPGRVVATEVLVATAAVRNLIRERHTEQLLTLIETGTQYGMHTMDKSLKRLFEHGVISYETAIAKVKNPDEFRNF